MFNKESYSSWKQRIQEQKISGMTIPEWCEKNQLSLHAYYYWRKVIRNHKDDPTVSPKTAFVEIQQIAPTPVLPCSVILTWNDISIHISSKHEALLAAEVIRALQTSCWIHSFQAQSIFTLPADQPISGSRLNHLWQWSQWDFSSIRTPQLVYFFSAIKTKLQSKCSATIKTDLY